MKWNSGGEPHGGKRAGRQMGQGSRSAWTYFRNRRRRQQPPACAVQHSSFH